MSIKNINIIFISLLLAFIAAIFGTRCYNQESIGDEVLYEYVWESDDNTNLWDKDHRLDRRVSSFSEIITSQIQHYKIANGRLLVHAGEQAFTDHKVAYSIINTFIFLLFLSLIVWYCFSKTSRKYFSVWFLVALTLLYCFPNAQLWVSINLAPNYLWPAMLSVLVLIVWDRIIRRQVPNSWIPLIVLLGLIFGWTHEGFVIGVGGGMFLYYCFHIKKFRGQILWLAVPMWLTAAIMIFSPGNLHRFFGSGEGSGVGWVGKILNALLIMSDVWLLWLFIIALLLIIAFKGRKYVSTFISQNSRLIFVFATAFVFSLIANTNPHSFSYVLLFAVLIFCKWISTSKFWSKKPVLVGAIILFIPFVCQQVLIARDNIINYRFQHRIIKEYKKSPDGIVEFDEPEYSPLARPFVKTWDLNEIRQTFPYQNWSKAYTNGKTSPLFLDPEEYKVISQPDSFFVEANKVKGNAPVYQSPGGVWMWVKPGEDLEGKQLEATLQSVSYDYEVSLALKIKLAIFSSHYDKKTELKVDTILSENSKYGRIILPNIYKIENINIKDLK